MWLAQSFSHPSDWLELTEHPCFSPPGTSGSCVLGVKVLRIISLQVTTFQKYKSWDLKSLALCNCFELPSDWLSQQLNIESEGSPKQFLYRTKLWGFQDLYFLNFFTCNQIIRARIEKLKPKKPEKKTKSILLKENINLIKILMTVLKVMKAMKLIIIVEP